MASPAAAPSYLGNFWVDLVRGTVRILLPMAILFAVILGSQGVIANFHGFRSFTTVEGVKQLIPGGPVAGFLAIKQIGSNGGGFFNVNSAHPFENPTQLANFVELYLTVALAFALAVAFGVLVKDKRQGRMVLGVMAGCGSPAACSRTSRRRTATLGSPQSAPTSRSPRTRAAGTWKAKRCATARRRRRSGAPR